ncbi:amidohydrolase/deacetylase family metallohydrolase [Catenuloplanes atrovinosus]|uniref:Dihydroorotase n=1 Tax=Catenuloplanes atrovinosus TaxID=137266 RepID=A0AAE3YSG4_9ACTN|nr:amidohydrolase/deacetylase family metallohydrolase [Catenuloplanes atrovinosus]MDR7279064.1 dihydroorotase [Catenuloplanes atrovinosus]
MILDLALTGGHVVDVGGDHVGTFDVGVRDGRIAAVAPRLDPSTAREVVDVRGKIVTPGLVDLHTHVHAGGGYWGIDPDPVAWYTGVTTWVDAGSAGAFTLGAFREAAARSRVRIASLLNISAVGLAGRTGEARDLAHCDVDLAIATITAHRELVRGVKVRMDRDTVGGNGLEPLRRGLTVAAETGVPLMVHIGTTPPALDDVLALLRPGDLVTHCASAIAAGSTLTHPALVEAYRRGVLFDLGHGSGGLAFDVLDAQLDAGLVPHTLSSDLHARSLYGPVFDLPTTLTKMLALGMPLPDVIARATVRPAQVLGLPTGTLAVGAPADLAVFTLREGPFEVVDAHQQRRTAARRLVNEATYVGGRLLPARLPEPPPSWIPLTPAQRQALHDRTAALRSLLRDPLVGADGLTEQFPRFPHA